MSSEVSSIEGARERCSLRNIKMSPPFTLDILEAGLSAVMGMQVVIVDTHKSKEPKRQILPTLTINDIFSHCYTTLYKVSDKSADLFPIVVKTLTSSTIQLEIASYFTIANIKAAIHQKEGIPVHNQMLYFNGIMLPDEETVEGAGILSDCTIFLKLNLRGSGGPPLIVLPQQMLAPEYDFDYRYICDGKTYERGGYPYQRPYGWYKYGINVQYYSEDWRWLGSSALRTSSTFGEWPVSYHGPTNKDYIASILRSGYEIGSGALHGRGVYSTPSIETAARYAATYTYGGTNYQMVLQNRVNPQIGHLIIVPRSETAVGCDEYWISPKQDPDSNVYDIRPYGILVRQI